MLAGSAGGTVQYSARRVAGLRPTRSGAMVLISWPRSWQLLQERLRIHIVAAYLHRDVQMRAGGSTGIS